MEIEILEAERSRPRIEQWRKVGRAGKVVAEAMVETGMDSTGVHHSTRVCIFWWHKSIGRNDFKVATYSIYLCGQIDDTLLKLQTLQLARNRRRLYMWKLEANSMPLVALIAYGSDGEATDRRD